VLELDMWWWVRVGLDREVALLQRNKQLVPRIEDEPRHQVHPLLIRKIYEVFIGETS
jgi:hypothetical protein